MNLWPWLLRCADLVHDTQACWDKNGKLLVMMVSMNLGGSVVVRWKHTCVVLVCLLASTTAGCGGGSESGTADGAIQGAPSVSDPSGRIPIVGNDESGRELDVPMFYTVAAYDVNRDPAADLIMTISKAKQENKRILLQVGGDWCNWCGRLAEFMSKRESVRALLDQHFLIMKVASQSKYADAFLADYPKINAYPFIYVLSPAGELLHSQDMEQLELDEGYDEEAFVDFLEAWGASHANGSPGLSSAEGQ